jgi:hypothetical protein
MAVSRHGPGGRRSGRLTRMISSCCKVMPFDQCIRTDSDPRFRVSRAPSLAVQPPPASQSSQDSEQQRPSQASSCLPGRRATAAASARPAAPGESEAKATLAEPSSTSDISRLQSAGRRPPASHRDSKWHSGQSQVGRLTGTGGSVTRGRRDLAASPCLSASQRSLSGPSTDSDSDHLAPAT